MEFECATSRSLAAFNSLMSPEEYLRELETLNLLSN